eukprot:4464500-Pleurochrysis_carterae.AAC.1
MTWRAAAIASIHSPGLRLAVQYGTLCMRQRVLAHKLVCALSPLKTSVCSQSESLAGCAGRLREELAHVVEAAASCTVQR